MWLGRDGFILAADVAPVSSAGLLRAHSVVRLRDTEMRAGPVTIFFFLLSSNAGSKLPRAVQPRQDTGILWDGPRWTGVQVRVRMRMRGPPFFGFFPLPLSSSSLVFQRHVGLTLEDATPDAHRSRDVLGFVYEEMRERNEVKCGIGMSERRTGPTLRYVGGTYLTKYVLTFIQNKEDRYVPCLHLPRVISARRTTSTLAGVWRGVTVLRWVWPCISYRDFSWEGVGGAWQLRLRPCKGPWVPLTRYCKHCRH